MSKAYLVLENGTVWEGESFGAPAESYGELVFTTGVNGHIETLSDPGYFGQIVVQTFPLLGAYGVAEEDLEGACRLSGYVVRDWCATPSNFRSQYDIDRLLKEHGVPGICGVDTRALTRLLRENGSMKACICAAPPDDLSTLQNFAVHGAAAAVSCSARTVYPADGTEIYRVALLDCGVKKSVIRALNARGCTVTVYPYATSAAEILADAPDGVILSDGPGDPAENGVVIETAAALAGKLPLLGCGLGHQIFARAMGAETQKMPHAHRGANAPVRDLVTGRTSITAQNHGYTVVLDSVTQGTIRLLNANDQSCEGIDYPALHAFTVQFSPVPGDGTWDRFIALLGGEF